MIKKFSDLKAYQSSKELYGKLIEMTRSFPREGKYLANQLNRAANSIHANIAEGYGRSEAEFKQYLTRALGSGNEVISHLDDALANRYLSREVYTSLFDGYDMVGKQIYRLREKWHKII
ncbi:MAG: four helix bundle protein [Candidatus Vogelbacteria bacterium]|nr:four helix bundle protein [Candidatus Vogelbacteria bacterium]